MQKVLDSLCKYFDLNPPASPSDIKAAETYFNLELPLDYKEFMQFTNGLEGIVNDSYLVLWTAEELIALNEAYNVKEFVSDILIIGSDGAEDAFAYDLTDMNIVTLPFIGMGHIAKEKVSITFQDFIALKINSIVS